MIAVSTRRVIDGGSFRLFRKRSIASPTSGRTQQLIARPCLLLTVEEVIFFFVPDCFLFLLIPACIHEKHAESNATYFTSVNEREQEQRENYFCSFGCFVLTFVDNGRNIGA